MGPLGFEPRTDGLKVSGSSTKGAPKGHQKGAKNSRENAGLRPPSRPKAYTCASLAAVRALAATICAGAVNPNASILLGR